MGTLFFLFSLSAFFHLYSVRQGICRRYGKWICRVLWSIWWTRNIFPCSHDNVWFVFISCSFRMVLFFTQIPTHRYILIFVLHRVFLISGLGEQKLEDSYALFSCFLLSLRNFGALLLSSDFLEETDGTKISLRITLILLFRYQSIPSLQRLQFPLGVVKYT